MRRLPWAIVVAAGLLAAAWNGEVLRGYVMTSGWQAASTMLGLLPFWAWLASIVIAVIAFLRMWREPEAPDAGHSFEVLSRAKMDPK